MASRQSRRPRRKSGPSIIVSACLAGIDCTYRCGNKLRPSIKRLVDEGIAVPVCPEVMGGLTTPRENSEIVGGDGSMVLAGIARVMSISGRDLTRKYIAGSLAISDIARRYNIREAILKSKSPACGFTHIYDGKFRNTLKRGSGVLAALLLKQGFKIFQPPA